MGSDTQSPSLEGNMVRDALQDIGVKAVDSAAAEQRILRAVEKNATERALELDRKRVDELAAALEMKEAELADCDDNRRRQILQRQRAGLEGKIRQAQVQMSVRERDLQRISAAAEDCVATGDLLDDGSELALRVRRGEVTPFHSNPNVQRQVEEESTRSLTHEAKARVMKRFGMVATPASERRLDMRGVMQRFDRRTKARAAPSAMAAVAVSIRKQRDQVRAHASENTRRALEALRRNSASLTPNSAPRPAIAHQNKPSANDAMHFEEPKSSQGQLLDGSKQISSQPSTSGSGGRGDELPVPSSDTSCAGSLEGVDRQVVFEGGYRIPATVYERLFPYQQVGIKWLWELYCQECGGIVGDEMGLGKTVQVAAFLSGLHHSGIARATVVVCPATVIPHWARELSIWCPSATVYSIFDAAYSREGRGRFVETAFRKNGILVLNYEQLRALEDAIHAFEWHCVFLDEGHRIRNPDAAVTLACKRFRTPHRIILTGAPIQNHLRELWSLFDFVYPGKLGTLPVFEAQFAVPIALGGYASASSEQVHTAFRCASTLRDLISPYLLRRMKKDVAVELPNKSEQVLFCRLTEEQRECYRAFLRSEAVADAMNGDIRPFAAISVLRKICNHPDLLALDGRAERPDDYGNPDRSGKMQACLHLLKSWHEQGHRVLLFAQTRQVLDLLEQMVLSHEFSYFRMDGSSGTRERQKMIDAFNEDTSVFVFLLTTRVGGLGVNLTGANRVLIFDPDWNPSTDVQARERSWRIGQTRDVAVYRLLTSGTIEEKIYHRQIFKQYLTNKVLQDPAHRRFFKMRDLGDLFSLGTDAMAGTETGDLFAGASSEITADTIAVPSASSDDAQASNGDQRETGLLQQLFDGETIQSSMDHDAIMDSGGVDRDVVERTAERIASRAARAVQASRVSRMQSAVSEPTWTGLSGSAGAPRAAKRARFGGKDRVPPTAAQVESKESDGTTALSSKRLLECLRARAAGGRMDETGGDAAVSRADIELATSVKDFFVRICPSASTSEVIEHFRGEVDERGAARFRAILRQMADFRSGEEGRAGRWSLKAEFF